MTPEQAYEEVARIAREHALVVQAAGGVITLAHPETQRQEGIYCHVQWVHAKGKHPDKDGYCKCARDGKGACVPR